MEAKLAERRTCWSLLLVDCWAVASRSSYLPSPPSAPRHVPLTSGHIPLTSGHVPLTSGHVTPRPGRVTPRST
eukprot:56188-Rhodomonas_salina.1